MDKQQAVAIPGQGETLKDVMEMGNVFFTSKLFKDVESAAQAVVKILAGRELGFGPMSSMQNINVVMGKVSLSALAMAALVKRGGRYNFRLVTHTINDCVIEFYDNGKLAYRSEFTIEDARKAGLAGKDLWQKYPRNLLFARALTNGARIVCPERLTGIDLSEDLSSNGVVDAVPLEDMTPEERQAQAKADKADVFGEDSIPDETVPQPAAKIVQMPAQPVTLSVPHFDTKGDQLGWITTQYKALGWDAQKAMAFLKRNWLHTALSQFSQGELDELCAALLIEQHPQAPVDDLATAEAADAEVTGK